MGITAEQRQRLFASFELADSSTTRKYGGSGLGLAITYNLVQLMQGDIRVENAPEQGCTFHFRIRLAKAKEEGHLLDTQCAPRRIVLLEPHVVSKGILIRQLAALSAHVICGDSPSAVLELLNDGVTSNEPCEELILGWQDSSPWFAEVL
ncbi:ATP-binding protein [Aeromonas jandaei]|uniref:ATP-binding protein n=1 Tax=Aeromonas jandaei TaxID=650 RepID=UPI003BA06A42